MQNEIILFETADKEIKLTVSVKNNTVWLNRNQLAKLFGRDVKTIGKHINNALKEELDNSVVANFALSVVNSPLAVPMNVPLSSVTRKVAPASGVLLASSASFLMRTEP